MLMMMAYAIIAGHSEETKMTINEQQKEEIRNGEKARCSICGKIVIWI